MLPLLLIAVLLAGCGGGDGGDDPGPTRVDVPAVQNATDLKKKPVPAAGGRAAPDGLRTRDLVVGSGPTATATSTVNVQYVGVLFQDGKEFDSSWKSGRPAEFPLTQVVPGFAQGITGMKVGGRRVMAFPGVLGYGEQGSPDVGIGPNAALTFVVDLLAVK
jgi:peptidylprolyl isomerase